MPDREILKQIWAGLIQTPQDGRKSRIASAIESRLAVETVSLLLAGGRSGPRILPESTELMPGLPLGDVLAEELGLMVPYGAVIVLEGTEFALGSPLSDHHIEWILDVALLDLAHLAERPCDGSMPAQPRPAAGFAAPEARGRALHPGDGGRRRDWSLQGGSWGLIQPQHAAG